MRDDITGEYPPDDEANWMLNRNGGCVFYSNEVGCTIHATRPMVCRLFCCDEFKRDNVIPS